MDRKKLEQTFCWKISSELKLFKYHIMQKTKEEIYACAYQIDCMVRIYESLAEMSQKMETEQLQSCIHISNLLAFLYGEWLKVPDTQNEELEHSLWSLIRELKTEKERNQEDEKTGIHVKAG